MQYEPLKAAIKLDGDSYPWTVIPLSERKTYMAALEKAKKASVQENIGAFATSLAKLVKDRLNGSPLPAIPSSDTPFQRSTGPELVYIGRMSQANISPKQVRDGVYGRHPKTETRMFGASLADVFRTPAYECRALGSDERPEFAVTRLRSGPRVMEKAPAYPPDQAILICVSLVPAALGQWRALYNGKSVGVAKAIPFATTFIDLNCRMEMWARGPFDYLHYYLSRRLLERIALDNDVSTSFCLQEAFFIEDLVVAQVTKSILTPVERGEPLDRLALDQIALVLGAHTLQARCGSPGFEAGPRRGLEAWQKLRSEEVLRAHLAGNITVKELASSCSLSGSHFARRFRVSFGISVHQRLIQLRIEFAKDLLSRSHNTLAEIALASGFYDQAAFSRTFSRVEHMSPSRWRRLNNSGKSNVEKGVG